MNDSFEAAMNTIWFVLYVVNSLVIWVGWIWLDTNGEFYTLNLMASLIIGVGGMLTAFFPILMFMLLQVLLSANRERRYY